MPKICQRVQDGYGMPGKWAPITVVVIFMGRVTSGPAAATEL